MSFNRGCLLFLFLYCGVLVSHIVVYVGTTSSGGGGKWVVLQRSMGISAMHMQVLRDNKVIIFDRTDFGPSNISLPKRKCRSNSKDLALKLDCTAHSILYDVASNTLRPLTVQTDTWCSSGAVNSHGTLIQTGGFNDGFNKLRSFTPCADDQCDWHELPEPLTNARWYSSNHILPDGRIIVVGGRSTFTYEFVPKTVVNGKKFQANYYLKFLEETRDSVPGGENNLYPFLHVLPDGNIFIFANKRSILLDYDRNKVLREYPVMPGDEKRNYPSTGSSVLLPLKLTGLGNGRRLPDAEVMICGGAFPKGFPLADTQRVYIEAARTCGRLKVTDPDPKWVMEEMPTPRVMPDMLILPTREIIILNGAANGAAGWEDAVNPVLSPVLYRPDEPEPLKRFQVLSSSMTPRMYHSSAVLLPDGRILVGGSNPHRLYDFTAPYPTDLSLDAYYPYYMGPEHSKVRPSIIAVEAVNKTVSYSEKFSIKFSLREYNPVSGISLSLIAPSFTTHSFAMNQRMLVLDISGVKQVAPFAYKVTAHGPLSPTLAPPGYYMLYLVHAGIPSVAIWVRVK